MVHVLDANSGKRVRSFPHGHDRNLSSLTLPTPSRHVTVPLTAYNAFLTNAPDNRLLLYDLRSAAVSQQFTGHVHRRERLLPAWSPHVKCVATGSEDGGVVLYDLAMPRHVRHAAHRDVVAAVAFHPLAAQLASAGYDGQVKFFADSAFH